MSLPANVRVYAATRPVDGRKGIDGLSAAVRSAMGLGPPQRRHLPVPVAAT